MMKKNVLSFLVLFLPVASFASESIDELVSKTLKAVQAQKMQKEKISVFMKLKEDLKKSKDPDKKKYLKVFNPLFAAESLSQKKKEYKEWCAEVGNKLMLDNSDPTRFDGKFSIEVVRALNFHSEICDAG